MEVKSSADLDLSGIDKLLERLADAERLEGRFGVVDDKGGENHSWHISLEITYHDLGMVLHNGDPDNTLEGIPAPIPPRPFFDSKAKQKKRSWKSAIKHLYLKPLLTKESFDYEAELLKLSKLFARDIKLSVIQWEVPENSPYTIAQKGFNDPLVETGDFAQSIKGVVIKK